MSDLVIAIDGPAGAGKSTVAKLLAKKLGLSYLDTGAMYRCLALKASRLGLTADQGDEAADLMEDIQISFGQGEPQPVFLDGEDVSTLIRTPDMGEFASAVSVHSPVRRAMVRLQRQVVDQGGLTLEGRDATTVIAPDADVKVYLTASVEERTRRRLAEMQARGVQIGYEELKKQIEDRDHRDSSRADSPLRIADGATVVDTDQMSIDEVVAAIEVLALSAKPA